MNLKIKNMNIKDLLSKRVFDNSNCVDKTEWQALGREISEYYGVKAYYLVAPYKNDLSAVRYAFKEAKTRNMPFKYLAAMLKFKKEK